MWVCSASSLVQVFTAAVMWFAAPHDVHPHGSAKLFVGSLAPTSVRINARGITVYDDTVARRDSSADTIAVIRGHGDEGGLIVVRADAGDRVRLFSDLAIPAGDHVTGDVVAVFGSVKVDAPVDGDVVAVFGSVELGPNASVKGDAVAIGGGLNAADGVRVGGDRVQLGIPVHLFGLPTWSAVLALLLVLWLSWFLLAAVAAGVFSRRLARVAVTASRRTAASLLLGLFAGPVLCAVGVGLMFTVIGIPVGVLLLLVQLVLPWAGLTAACQQLGCKLLRRDPATSRGLAPLVAGSLFVTSVFGFAAILWGVAPALRIAAVFFLIVGGLFLWLLSAVGSGAILLSLGGRHPEDAVAANGGGAAAPVAVPAPSDVPPVA